MTQRGTKSFIVDTTELEKMAAALSVTDQIVQSEMVPGMRQAGEAVRDAAVAHIHNRSGELAASGRAEITATGQTVECRVRFGAKYAFWVEEGRGPVVAKGRALRFVIGGVTLFRKRVGPAAGVHYLRKGYEDAKGRVDAILRQTADRIARRIEAAI